MENSIYIGKTPVQRIAADGESGSYLNLIWNIFIVILMAAGAAAAAIHSWSDKVDISLIHGIVIIITILCCAAAQALDAKGKKKASLAVDILPLPFVLAITGFRGYMTGFLSWINIMIQHLNSAGNRSISLFNADAGASEILSFELLLIVIILECAWHFVFRRQILPSYIFCIFWLIIPVMEGKFQPAPAACLISAIIMILVKGAKLRVLKKDIIWCLSLAAAICVCAFLTSDRVSDMIDSIRNSTADTIYEFRYGNDQMVNGDMREAAKLHESEDSMFTFQSGQEKDIYLRAFSSGAYSNGLWSELPDTAYSGENSGMMKWLADKGFDPMTQTSEYYKLSDGASIPEKNRINLTIAEACREYLYVPASLEKINRIRYSEKNDSRIASKGIVGARIYSYSEISGSRPSELTVPESWVSSPKNSKQKNYSEAEAVYRQFVYDNYLSVNRNIYNVINQMFWEGYDDDTGSVYSAVCRVRDVLEQNVGYTEKPAAAPVDRDAIVWFLTEAREGNAVMYASTAVEALRAHGIPARYAEGYFISSNDIADGKSGKVYVTGKNMHAWTEVYFDGVGWMPIDVTPGYYYNVTALQEMVSAPDTIRQTAAIEEDQSQSQDITDSATGGSALRKNVAKKIENVAVLTAGAFGIVISVIAVILCILEAFRAIFIIVMKKRYRTESAEKRIRELERRIFRVLEIRGLDVRLGWKTGETDEKLAETCANVKQGEYKRVCSILEKSVYGGIALEQYEERTLSTFLQKVSEPEKSSKWKTRLMLRYMGVM